MRWKRTLLPLSLMSAAILVLPACSVLEDFGLLGATTEETAEIVDEATPETPEPAEEEIVAPTDEGLVIPDCDNLYSSELTTTLQNEVRVNFGNTSEGDFGYGTTNLDLVKILQNTRSDLTVSCTWVLQASESASVTSAAVITSDVEQDVRGFLSSAGGSGEDSGGGYIWTVESPLSEISPDIDATEVHYLAEIACPSSVADPECVLWVTTNYSFGEARVLTLDAATELGAYTN